MILVCIGLGTQSNAQNNFPEKCEGIWEGMMMIYSQGKLRDSVKVQLSVVGTSDLNTWDWKTEYLSERMPMVKDYKLRLVDAVKQEYVIDEGEGLELNSYLFGDKLYSIFETSGFLLTSTYELNGDNLVFEVTSGKILDQEVKDVANYSVSNTQRVVFNRISE